MFHERMKELGRSRSAIRELFEYGKKRKAEIGEENVFDFSLGNPSVPAPECVGEEIARLLATIPAERLHGYTSATGDGAVREQISAHFLRSQGVEIPPDFIYLTCGAAASLTIVLHAMLQGGEEVIVLTPYFPEYRVFVEGAKGKVVEVPTDARFHLDLEAIEKAITSRTRAIIVNSPNNPTGAVYGEEELKELAKLLVKKSKENGSPIFLIADEPYRELTYEQPALSPLNFYDDTVVCYSFSKCLSLAGERIGYLAVSPKAQNAKDLYFAVCGAGRSLGFVCAPSLFQRVAGACLGQTSDFTVYRENRDLLYGALKRFGFECEKPEGAFYLFLKVPQGNAVAFCERAKAHELLLVPSNSFGVEGYARLSFCVSHEMITRSLPAFEALAKEYF